MTSHDSLDQDRSGGNRAAVLVDIGRIELQVRPRPTPCQGEVLVRVETVTVCGSDVHYYQHGRIADFVVTAPLVLGHEAAGTILEAGPNVDTARIGERVVLEPGIACGSCRACLTGRYNLCPDMRFHATPPYDGSLQQYITLPARLAHALPLEILTEEAPLLEPVAVAVMACRRAGALDGADVLVTGAGAVGLFCAQVARAFGAASVVVCDLNADRRSAAARTDLETCAPEDLAAAQADVLLECTGSGDALRAGLAALRSGGRVVTVGLGANVTEVPVDDIVVREISMFGSFRYANTFPAAIALAKDKRVRWEGFVSGHFPLARTQEAMDLAAGAGGLRVAIHPSD